jgi:peptide chain release factor 1
MPHPALEEVRMTDSKNLFRIPQLVTSLRDLADSEPDEDMRKLAESDLPPAEAALTSARHHLLQAVAPSPPVSALSALVELKSGVGGNEASLFAAELVRMYQRLAQRKGWKAQVVEAVSVEGVGAGSATGGVAGAYKEALVEVTGQGAFGYLRREAGVHRVQRVPATESQGRVHTSTVGIIASFFFPPPHAPQFRS